MKKEQTDFNTESIEDVREEDTENGQSSEQALKNAYVKTKEKLNQYKGKSIELEEKLKEYEQILGDASPSQVKKWKQASEDFQATIAKKEQKYEEAISLRESQLEEVRRERDSLEKENTDMRLASQLEEAFYAAGGKKGHFAALELHLMRISQLNDTKQLEIYPNGTLRLDKNGQPKSSSEVIAEEFASSELWGVHFEPKNNSVGGGMQRSESFVKNTNIELNDLLPVQRRIMARAQGIKE